jgi:hypothetical protein
MTAFLLFEQPSSIRAVTPTAVNNALDRTCPTATKSLFELGMFVSDLRMGGDQREAVKISVRREKINREVQI